ncbi:hypothetical protein LKI_01815 [Leuconostoc kimchii IMSNU 11154]|uniref:Uncharacterized protein n=1 Tax=Leuconostoc kimchii (strain IMSNU 11154 / KCTC 2386 / IH25) TaxID=762051 RepID=D5T0V7_LEUKI|nr:hypothetical protein LKI_01815 [Leuconostoc kimchii IMSNU 11154]
MKVAKRFNKSKVNSSYLRRLKISKKVIIKEPFIFAGDSVAFNSVSVYKRGVLIDQYSQKV